MAVRELRQPITLSEMKGNHEFKLARRGLVHLPQSIGDMVDLDEQKMVSGVDLEKLMSVANI
ncbi:hypothetical protein N7488_002835 [Penicillium malachiteum]|nr:hypothetical protein N7488_002835 [Penicillium malachiteum]